MDLKNMNRASWVRLTPPTPETLVWMICDFQEVLSHELVFMGKTEFTHHTVIHGDERSLRVFLCEQVGDAIPLPKPWSASLVIAEICKFTREARYPDPLNSRAVQGWELFRTCIEGRPAVIVGAIWC